MTGRLTTCTYIVSTLFMALVLCGELKAQVIKKPDTLSLVFTGDDAYPPFEYLDESGNPAGFDIEVMNAIAEVMGIKLSIQLGDWYENLEKFDQGEYNGLAGAYYTDERAEKYLFGSPYARNFHTIFVREGSPINNLNDIQRLERPSIITQNSDVLISFIKNYNKNAQITIVRNYEQALRLLAEGDHDCAIISRILGEYHIDKYALTNIKSLQDEFLPREYSFAMHKNDSILVSIFNQGLRIIRNTGKYDKIKNKYLGKYDKQSFSERYLQYIKFSLGILILIIITFYVYSFSLKKQVRLKTKQLEIELEEKRKTEDMLLVERDKAREADKLKSAFLANMSHEIRTPMNAIVGFSRLLEESDISQTERSEYVNIINKNSETLLALINDIIDLAKIESGQIIVEKINFCINNSIKAQIETLRHELKNKGKEDIEIIHEIPLSDDQAMINTDIVRLNQVLTNLTSNAAKFTDSGSITIGYRKEDEYIRFYVEDTGIGIPKEKQEIIFDQFRQADDSYTRKYGGTGLGLTICRELVHALEGQLSLTSTKGKGTRVEFIVPQGNIENTDSSKA